MPSFQTHRRFYKGSAWHFPFSIWYIGSYLKRRGWDVTIFDYNLGDTCELFGDFPFVGITCLTAQVPEVRRICRRIRELDSKSRIVLGGIHPTLFPEQRSIWFDYLCEGNAMPFETTSPLDYSLLDKQMMHQPKNYLGLVTSHGCPYKCTFCINSILDQPLEYWTTEQLCFEVQRGLGMGFKGMFFWDDNFFALRRRTMEFMDFIERKQLKFEWFAFTRANQVNKKLFSRAYDCGLRRVSLGAESGSDRVLTKLRKGVSSSGTLRSARILEDIGIEANFSYMTGLPGETTEDIKKTIWHIGALGRIQKLPKITGPMLYMPFPGSELYNECVQAGWKQPKRFEDWTDETNGFTDDVWSRPWIQDKYLTNYLWFYSIAAALPIHKLIRLYLTYIKRMHRSVVWVALVPIVALWGISARLRGILGWYRFPLETRLLAKWRGVLAS